MCKNIIFVFCLLLFLNCAKYSIACNGYELKLLYFKDCNENNIMKITNAGITLDADCKAIPTGCFKTAGFNTAMLHYRVEKKPLPALEGDMDFCKALEAKNDHSDLLGGIKGLPEKCSMDGFEKCIGDGEQIDISKFKNKLSLGLGVSVINITVKHENGETCWTMSAEIKRNKKSG